MYLPPRPLHNFTIESVERKKLRSRIGDILTAFLTTWRGIYSFLKCREVLSLHRPYRFLQPLLQLRDGLAATSVLFELTSFPVMRENRYGYTTYPTSYKWRLFGSLSASVYTTASVHRCASPPVTATKFAGPTSFTEPEGGAK